MQLVSEFKKHHMESLARFFSSFVLIVFIAGVVTALAPRFFIQMGERQAGQETTAVNNRNLELEAELAEAQRALKGALVLAERAQSLRQQAEERALNAASTVRKKEAEMKALAQNMKDSSALLASQREMLDDANEAIVATNCLLQENEATMAKLEDSLRRTETAIAEQHEEIDRLTPLAEQTEAAQRQVEMFKLSGLVVLLLAIIFVTLRYWYRNRKVIADERPVIRMFSAIRKVASMLL
jgi:glutaredoxin 2